MYRREYPKLSAGEVLIKPDAFVSKVYHAMRRITNAVVPLLVL